MNLIELINYICTQTGLLTPQDIAACRQFVSKRYELIYNSYLWKDTLGGVNITVNPTTDANNAEGVIILPEIIDHVVGVRSPTNSLRVYGLEDFYRIDYDQFQSIGSAWKFAILSPVWFIWRGYYGLTLVTSDADSAAQMKITWRDESGNQFVQRVADGAVFNSVNLGPNLIPAGAVYDAGGEYDLVVTAGGLYSYSGDQFRNGGGNPGTNPVVLDSTQNTYMGVAGQPVNATLQLWEPAKLEIESLFKPATNATISLSGVPFDGLTQPAGASLSTSDTASPSHTRIRVFPIPQNEVVLSVLGKKRFTPLDFDQEVPLIRNLDNCLIAFGCADMLTTARRFGQAAQKMQEGEVLLGELAKLYAIQEANFQRFVPDGTGYGDAWTGPNQSCYWGVGGWG